MENRMSKIRKLDIEESSETSVQRPEAPIDPGATMAAATRFGQRYNEGMTMLGQEMLDYWRRRLSRNAVAALSLARCTDWNEASRIHQDWMKSATEDYVAQMGSMVQLAIRTTMESCRSLNGEGRTTAETRSPRVD